MRLMRINVLCTEGNYSELSIELGAGFTAFLDVLEKSPQVISYKVHDLVTMEQALPENYGYNWCLKWEHREYKRQVAECMPWESGNAG